MIVKVVSATTNTTIAFRRHITATLTNVILNNIETSFYLIIQTVTQIRKGMFFKSCCSDGRTSNRRHFEKH